MTTHVLFMCPHGAGKSLAAATYFRAAAARAGVRVTIGVAGPEPDEVNMPSVAAALSSQGYTIDWHPRLVDEYDTTNADLLISLGCEQGSIPTDKTIIEWDVPLLSEDFMGSMQAIHDHAESLASQMHGS